MKPEDPHPGDPDLLRRYHAASEAQPLQPSKATRRAILAEAARVAAAQAQPEAAKPFDTRAAAANQSRFRLAAFGTVGAALLAALVIIPAYRQKAVDEPARTASTVAPAARPRAEQNLPAEVVDAPPAATALAPAPAPYASAPSAQPAAKIAAGARARDRQSDAKALENRTLAAQTSASAGVAESAPTASRAARSAQIAPAAPQAFAKSTAPAPLLAAVGAGDLARLNQLLAAGAASSESDDAGRSPLLLAVLAQRADLVGALLAHGADANAADRSGQTPLAAARALHRQDLIELLQAAGAREP